MPYSLRFSPAVRRGAGLLASCALLFAAAGVAEAHSALVRANISSGAVFTQRGRTAYPHILTAFFSENLRPSASWVHVFEGDTAGDHGRVDIGAVGFPLAHPKEMTVALPAGLRGTYTLMWYTTSEDDGHTAGNAYAFTVK